MACTQHPYNHFKRNPPLRSRLVSLPTVFPASAKKHVWVHLTLLCLHTCSIQAGMEVLTPYGMKYPQSLLNKKIPRDYFEDVAKNTKLSAWDYCLYQSLAAFQLPYKTFNSLKGLLEWSTTSPYTLLGSSGDKPPEEHQKPTTYWDAKAPELHSLHVLQTLLLKVIMLGAVGMHTLEQHLGFRFSDQTIDTLNPDDLLFLLNALTSDQISQIQDTLS